MENTYGQPDQLCACSQSLRFSLILSNSSPCEFYILSQLLRFSASQQRELTSTREENLKHWESNTVLQSRAMNMFLQIQDQQCFWRRCMEQRRTSQSHNCKIAVQNYSVVSSVELGMATATVSSLETLLMSGPLVLNISIDAGGCCPESNRCCSYGYCLEPGKTCCPNGPCGVGKTCCENGCIPDGTACCRNGDYCEAGNMCVLYQGKIGCCTDLQCTAVVRGGTTSFARTTTPAPPAPTITPPPRTTRVVVDSFTTYYWTVRWRYFSYYWTIFQARSTVTYTTITYTTIYTTTATDDSAASAIFADLSKTITFSTPAEATTLASLLDAVPSPTANPTTALETELGSSVAAGPTSRDISLAGFSDAEDTTSRSSTTRTSSRITSSSSAPSAAGGGGASAAGSVVVQMTLLALAGFSGVLMFWL